jgi:hypothetical protein
MREEHRFRVFENSVQREIFGPKRDEDTRSWRKLHKQELHKLYSSLNTVMERGVEVCTGFIWLRIGPSGELL